MDEIRKCRARDIFEAPNGAELIAEYAEECGNALVGRPAPRLDYYESLEHSGLGQCFAAYDEGRLCGFAMVIVAIVPHYSLSCANVESLFMSRDARGGGLALMRVVDDYAQERGCKAIYYTAPVKTRLARMLFLCSDIYANTNHVFCKGLN